MSFASSMEAKEYLASRIVGEAKRRHVGLSELERKMLFFSEGYPTLPDMMEVNEEFEAQYNNEKYEKKIRKLSRKAFEHDREESPESIQLWREAIQVLKKEDHYLLAMLDVPWSAADLAKLLMAVSVLGAILVGATSAVQWVHRHVHIRIPDWVDILVIILVIALAYFLAYSRRAMVVDNYVDKLVKHVARWF
jgi:hypothetical protein